MVFYVTIDSAVKEKSNQDFFNIIMSLVGIAIIAIIFIQFIQSILIKLIFESRIKINLVIRLIGDDKKSIRNSYFKELKKTGYCCFFKEYLRYNIFHCFIYVHGW